MAPIAAIAPGVFRIPTAGDFINTFAFADDDESVTLVDTGLKFAPGRIVRGLAAIGKRPCDVRRIILTHAHDDHAGGAAEMLRRSGAAGVGAHTDDAEYLAAGHSPPRDETVTFGKIFARLPIGGFDPVPVAQRFTDGQQLDVAGGLTVHHTPGHTPGHVSLRHERTGVLITGDAIWNMASRMTWPVAQFCTSARLNQQTAHLLGELDYRVAAFTHGPHISDNAREQVRDFLRRRGA